MNLVDVLFAPAGADQVAASAVVCHQFLRELRDEEDDSEARKSDGDLDAQVAKEFKISRVYVSALVVGKSRPKAGGPLDHRRNRILELFWSEADALGPEEAYRRRRLRNRGIDPEPKAVRWSQRAVILDAKGRETGMAYTLEPGQSIRVELVAEGGQR